jgi:hypothetical protein
MPATIPAILVVTFPSSWRSLNASKHAMKVVAPATTACTASSTYSDVFDPDEYQPRRTRTINVASQQFYQDLVPAC